MKYEHVELWKLSEGCMFVFASSKQRLDKRTRYIVRGKSKWHKSGSPVMEVCECGTKNVLFKRSSTKVIHLIPQNKA